MNNLDMNTDWPLYKRFFFIFFAAYYTIYIISIQQVTSLPFIDSFWEFIVPKFSYLMGVKEDISNDYTGSGDTTFDYYRIFLIFILSLILASLFSRRSKWNYQTLLNGLSTFIRYYLIINLFIYGIAKFFDLQFGPVTLAKLDQKLGDFSPMGLLWTFMGHSKAYTSFAGISECVGAVFLLDKRTTTLGAIISLGVLTNVLMVNFCFDAPVKLLSMHLVSMAVLLIYLDRQRLFSFFIKSSSVEGINIINIVPDKWVKKKNITKWILVIGLFSFTTYKLMQLNNDYQSEVSSNELEGAFKVKNLDLYKNDSIINAVPEYLNWTSLYPSNDGYIGIQINHEAIQWDQYQVNHEKKHLEMMNGKDSVLFSLKYALTGDSLLHLNGHIFEDSVSIELNRVTKEDHLLTRRKFNWVQEYPFNR